MKTIITVGIIGAVALGAWYIYERNQAALNTNTVGVGGTIGGLGIGGNLNLNTAVADLGSLFGGGSSN